MSVAHQLYRMRISCNVFSRRHEWDFNMWRIKIDYYFLLTQEIRRGGAWPRPITRYARCAGRTVRTNPIKNLQPAGATYIGYACKERSWCLEHLGKKWANYVATANGRRSSCPDYLFFLWIINSRNFLYNFSISGLWHKMYCIIDAKSSTSVSPK